MLGLNYSMAILLFLAKPQKAREIVLPGLFFGHD